MDCCLWLIRKGCVIVSSAKFMSKQLGYRLKYLLRSNSRVRLGRWENPYIVSIETVLGCNLRCPECAFGGGHITRECGVMSFDTFKLIADKVTPYAKYMYLHSWGEPLLNKDIFNIIDYASRICRTNISTNGMLINEESAERLILSGVGDVIVSIDGVSQEVYEQYRAGGDVNKALNALKLLVEKNKKHGRPANIIPQFVVFEHNQHEMQLFDSICRELGEKPSFKAPYIRKDSRFKNSSYNAYIRTPFIDRKAYEEAILDCEAFRDTLYIDLKGNVGLCCYDANSSITFGNILSDSLEEIYRGDKYIRFMEKVREKRICPQFCLDNCLLFLYEDS